MASNKLSKGGSGGGIDSNQRREVGVRNGSGSKGVSPRGVSQVGGSYGNHATDRVGKSTGAVEPIYGGPSFQSVPFGNEVSAATKCGPGGSRNLYGQSGSQQQYGPAAPGVDVGSGPSTRTGRDLIK